ncbi:hypothetical protein JDV02_006675 [Purpureocillium takamizusanense]|uniref:Uncharacterized protein n=1 Tax=Purpureocillium takamizusanense TaxID=2060973 RepID=A0A9Q8QGS0_9HYPO|nr:uncharacterized protein JDV02_006675 [Purpureocillium takamizusanense]UNI20604.1 hypothetical protein JDV02_006675 [Purpureocillium takamizusanense]
MSAPFARCGASRQGLFRNSQREKEKKQKQKKVLKRRLIEFKGGFPFATITVSRVHAAFLARTPSHWCCSDAQDHAASASNHGNLRRSFGPCQLSVGLAD